MKTTPDMLGPEATERDAHDFDAAVERVCASTEYGGDPEGATEYVWNNGAIRMNAGTCIYCDRPVPNVTLVPKPDDNDGWGDVAAEHEKDCEWVATRAHWRNAK